MVVLERFVQTNLRDRIPTHLPPPRGQENRAADSPQILDFDATDGGVQLVREICLGRTAESPKSIVSDGNRFRPTVHTQLTQLKTVRVPPNALVKRMLLRYKKV